MIPASMGIDLRYITYLYYEKVTHRLSYSMRIIDPELQARRNARNESMRKDFLKKHAEGFRCEVILAGLADKYFLSVGTVEAIVMKWGKYREQLQTNSSHERSILNTH